MVEAGHTVEIITAHNNKKYVRKEIDGFQIHYLPVRYHNTFGFLRRLYAFLLFAHKAYYLGRKCKDINLAYITSTPLTVGLAALKLKKNNTIPYVFEVRDLWPEAPIQIGTIRSQFFKYITRKLEIAIYRNASKIVALSPGINDYISKLVPEKPVHFCSNISDCSFFKMTDIKNPALLKKHEIDASFVISYFGAIGKVNALENFLNIAKASAEAGLKIKFLMIGEGAMSNSLREKARDLDLKNMEFIPHMNKYDLKDYLTIIDAAYISFANFPVMEHNSPNKFFDAIASGKLVITNTRGWTKDLIEKNQCGFFIDPETPNEIITKIKPFFNKLHLKTYQQNSRRLAENTFEKKRLIPDLLKFIEH
jgi:glycosyltransferase involved in cell wall biosynthesis